MNKSILNIAAITLAFCLGLSIHNSCADQDVYDISALRAEVESLKSTVQTLMEQNAAGDFKVGDLWYSRNGEVISPVKSVDTDGTVTTYTYDESGRLLKQESVHTVTTYSYDGNKVYVKEEKLILGTSTPIEINRVYEFY